MSGSFTGAVLFVDLTSGSIDEERLPESVYRNFIGGAGLGARIMYERMDSKVDPLGPENILGFVPGLLTGTRVPMAAKYVVATKSPLTGTWADSNSGGYFGYELKAAGYDAIFFAGISPKPVYLLVYQDKVELRDAAHLWGRDTVETQQILRQELGDRKIRIACIGPSGESRSLLASVINEARAAARQGVGAVMGAKKLKAIVARGTKKIEIANPERFNSLRKVWLKSISKPDDTTPFLKKLSIWGASMGISDLIPIGATPVKNWSLIGSESFPDYDKVAESNVTKYRVRKQGCYGCPIVCGGIVSAGKDPYQVREGPMPEYETLASFGPMCLNSNIESIIKANDICNRYGIDTISAGTVIAFAMECYENGIIGKKESGGIELTWGSASAIIAVLEKIVKREGFGSVLADGVQRAAEIIGRGADRYAIHVHGQEPGYHDPRLNPLRGLAYIASPRPGRHMNAEASIRLEDEGSLGPYPELKAPQRGEGYERKGQIHAIASSYNQTFSDSGMCLFALTTGTNFRLPEFISAVTGWDFSAAEAISVGKRIQTLRQAFNTREGLSAKEFSLPERIAKAPTMGPYGGRSIDFSALKAGFYAEMGWDVITGQPLESTVEGLGLKGLICDSP